MPYYMPLRDRFFTLIDRDEMQLQENPLSPEEICFQEFLDSEIGGPPQVQIEMKRDLDGNYIPDKIRVA
jgi:hypothetical protein